MYKTRFEPDRYFADAFVRKNVAYSYDVVSTLIRSKIYSHAILFREIQCKKSDILMFQQRFQCKIGWNKPGKICKNNDHTCLMYCINACRVPKEMFEHLAC